MIVATDEEEEYTSEDEVALRRSSRLRRGPSGVNCIPVIWRIIASRIVVSVYF